MKLTWITETLFKGGFRAIKTRMTSGIIETSKASMPFGFEGNPTKNYIAILAETKSREEPVIIGYLDPRALTNLGPGDSMQYATDDEGNKTATLKLRSNGIAEILGDSDNAVRYSKLEEAFKELNDKFNTFANSYVPGGPSNQGQPITIQPSNADITKSKIEEIKVP